MQNAGGTDRLCAAAEQGVGQFLLLNDTKWEIRQEMNRQGLKPGAMAASCGVSRQAFWRSTDTVPVTRTFLHIWEALGYDVRIVYEKREEL